MSTPVTEPHLEASERSAFGGRVLALADHLAQFSESSNGLTCTYLSHAHRAVAGELATLMAKAGLELKSMWLAMSSGAIVHPLPTAKPSLSDRTMTL